MIFIGVLATYILLGFLFKYKNLPFCSLQPYPQYTLLFLQSRYIPGFPDFPWNPRIPVSRTVPRFLCFLWILVYRVMP